MWGTGLGYEIGTSRPSMFTLPRPTGPENCFWRHRCLRQLFRGQTVGACGMERNPGPERLLRNHLLVELPVDDLCRHLDERMGRPSKDLHVVIGVLLLQQLHDLSDAETVEALAFNMAWHYALDVRSEADSYFCEKTLRNYRRLFIEQGLDELLFRCLTDRMVQGFSVDTSHQRMDSTALRSAMRALTRLGIVVESIELVPHCWTAWQRS